MTNIETLRKQAEEMADVILITDCDLNPISQQKEERLRTRIIAYVEDALLSAEEQGYKRGVEEAAKTATQFDPEPFAGVAISVEILSLLKDEGK